MEFDGAPMETTQAVSLGTTIMAASFDGGVILGADTRTSSGSYIANRVQSKLTPLTENVYIARSGSAADTQAVATYVHYFLAQHMAETGEPVTVKAAANMVMQMAYQNKSNLTAGMIVAGWDAQRGGTVWAVPIGGTLVQTPFTAGGSGSIYINGFCDRMWRPKMSQAECRAFVMKAVGLAMARDGSSGGCIRLVTVTKDGAKAEFIPGTSIPPHHGELTSSSVTALGLPA